MSGPVAAPIVDHYGQTQGVDQFVQCRNCGYEAGDPGEDWLPVQVRREQWRAKIRAVREMAL